MTARKGRRGRPPQRPKQALAIDTRRALGWSQKQIAIFLGTSEVSVSRWETGLSGPSDFQSEMLRAFDRAAVKYPFAGDRAWEVYLSMGLTPAMLVLLAMGTP